MRFVLLLSLINFLQQLSHNVAIFPGNIANHYYLNKQKFLLEILHHLQEPLLHEQWIALGQQIVSDESQYVHYNEHMRKFYQRLSSGSLLARNVYYSPQHPEHCQQTLGLYHFFYNTREWSTLRQNICWARLHVNPGIFLNALIQTMLKRDDYRLLIMPKIYELLPAPYHSEKLIGAASKFNYANWIRQQLLYGNESDVNTVLSKELLPLDITGDLRKTSKWSDAMSDVHILSLKETRKTAGLGHLTEDVGWRAYWYYINMGIALQEQQTETDRLRDWWYWQLNQLVARYKLERYGQKLQYKSLLRIDKPEIGHLLTWQSQRYQLETEATTKNIKDMLDKLEMGVEQALSTQSYLLANGTLIDLHQGENWLIGLAQLFPYDLSQFQITTAAQPQQLMDLHTMLHYSNFYSYAERLLQAYRSYRSEFQPSYQQPVKPNYLRIQEVRVSPLVTYDELVDVDLSNILHTRHFYYENQFNWSHSLQARQFRLQQKDFRIELQLISNKTQSIILRTYLTTSTGSLNEEPIYQLDAFLTILYAGNNTITRESRDFSGTIGDHISFTEIYQYVKLAELGNYDFPLNITIPSCGFPRRLILPKGGIAKPLSMRLLIIATPYNYKARQGNELNCDFSNGVSSWDDLPFGYPFERHVKAEKLLGAHTYWQAVKIYHEDHTSTT